MRDKLIETIQNSVGGCARHWAEVIADGLIDSGVILPPCKVGDVVWRIEDVWHLDDKAIWKYHYEKEVLEFMVRSISVSCNSKGVWTKKFRICEIQNGKTIYIKTISNLLTSAKQYSSPKKMLKGL